MGNAVQYEATVCVAQESIRWKGNRIRDNEDTCKDGDSDTYKCVYVIVQSRQKRKSTLLSHRKRRRTHIGLLFEFQWLKIGCFKTAVLKNT